MCSESESPWLGDWQRRITSGLNAHGFQRLSDFAQNHPVATYVELADALAGMGCGRVAPVQVEAMLQAEADDDEQFTAFVQSSLVRHLRDSMRRGWGVGRDPAFRQADAYAAWMSRLPEECEQLCRQVWQRLKDLNPHRGWSPSGPDDPLISAAFSGQRLHCAEQAG